MFAKGAIAWKTGKPTIVPGSTAHAELAGGFKAANQTGAVRSVLSDMRCPVARPTPLLGDSQAACNIVTKVGATLRTRHFERSTMMIKQLYALRVAEPHLVGTKSMVADLFTKVIVEPAAFFQLRDYLLNLQNGPGMQVVFHGQAARLWQTFLELGTKVAPGR